MSDGARRDPTPDYHYLGTFKSYVSMWNELIKQQCCQVEYSPLGLHHAFNFYAIHLCKEKMKSKWFISKVFAGKIPKRLYRTSNSTF